MGMNLIVDTVVYLSLLYSLNCRYKDNWYIIEDLALPSDLGAL